MRAQTHTFTPAGPTAQAATVDVAIRGGLPASRIIDVAGDWMAA